jgi:hypothetical protein
MMRIIRNSKNGVSSEELSKECGITPTKVTEFLTIINNSIALLWMDEDNGWHFWKLL